MKKIINIGVWAFIILLSQVFFIDVSAQTDWQYIQDRKIISQVSNTIARVEVKEVLWKESNMVIYNAEGLVDKKQYVIVINDLNFKDLNLDKNKDEFSGDLSQLPSLTGEKIAFYGEKIIYEGMEDVYYIQVVYGLRNTEEVIDNEYIYKSAPYMPVVQEIRGKLFIRNTDVPHISISTPNGIFELALSSQQKAEFEKMIGKYVVLRGKEIVRANPYYHYMFIPMDYKIISEKDLTEPLFGDLIPYINKYKQGTSQVQVGDPEPEYGNGLITTWVITTYEIILK